MLTFASSRKRRARRRAGAAALATTAAVLLSGCYGISGQTGAQLDVVGDVDVTTALCAKPQGNVDADGCVVSGSAFDATQLFYAYQLPDGVTAPATITAGGALETVSFTKDSEYAELVQGATPALTGTHWVSYRSGEVPAVPSVTARIDASVKAHFGIAGLGDAPFTIRTVEAFRWIRPADDAASQAAWTVDRPIVCGDPQPSYNQSTDATSCAWSTWPRPAASVLAADPDPTTPTTPAAVVPVQTIPLNRLALTAPSTIAAVMSGETVTVSFAAKSTLADAATPASVPIEATSEIPGASVVAPTSLAIGGAGSVDLTVAVPAGTPAGDYKVGVRVGERTGAQFQEATVHVNAPVVAPTAPATTPVATPPVVELTIPQKLANAAQELAAAISAPAVGQQLRKGGATLPITLPTRGTVRVSLLGKAKKKGAKAPVLAVGTAKSGSGGLTDVKLHRTADGKRIFGSGKVTVSGTLVVRLWGPTGKTVSTPVTITLG